MPITDTLLGELRFKSIGHVEVHQTVRLTGPLVAVDGKEPWPARQSIVRPMCFGKFPEHPVDWELSSIMAAGREQLVSYPVPLSLFVHGDREPFDLHMPTLLVGQEFAIEVTNISGAPKPFACTFIARVVEAD